MNPGFDHSSFHFVVTGLATVAAIPLLLAVRLPIRFEWAPVFSAFWLKLGCESIVLAGIMFLLAAGTRYLRAFARDRHGRVRRLLSLVVLLALLAISARFFLIAFCLVIIGEKLATSPTHGAKLKYLFDVLLPAAYLFVGLLTMFAYNNVIVSVRDYRAYDPFFLRVDSWILFGHSISGFAHRAADLLPFSFFQWMSAIYWGMFTQLGAGLILCASLRGRASAFRLVGALLIAYYTALLIFFLFPSVGPFYGNATLPYKNLSTYVVQEQLLQHAAALARHDHLQTLKLDYFVAFPCLHIALPVIVLWFLRKFRGIALFLIAYDAALVLSILILEWHYAVDLVGGVAVAAVALLAVGQFSRSRRPSGTEENPV